MFRSSMDTLQFKKRINQHVFTKSREWHDLGAESSDEDNENAKMTSSSDVITTECNEYVPSFADVLILLSNVNKTQSFAIPLILVVEIFRYADYLPKTLRIRDQIVPGGRDQNDLHLSLPLKFMKYFKVNDIVYTVVSKDQGWSSSPQNQKGTRFGSYTWAEAAISSDSTVRYEVCVNVHAGTAYEKQIKEFDADSDLCNALSSQLQSIDGRNDESKPIELQLWIRSLYPGWANHVKYGEICVRWALDKWEDFISSMAK